MQTHFTPTAAAHTPPILSSNDYTFASCAEQKRTDWRAEPVIALAPSTKPRKPSSYTARTKRMFSLDANDAVAAHLMGCK